MTVTAELPDLFKLDHEGAVSLERHEGAASLERHVVIMILSYYCVTYFITVNTQRPGMVHIHETPPETVLWSPAHTEYTAQPRNIGDTVCHTDLPA